MKTIFVVLLSFLLLSVYTLKAHSKNQYPLTIVKAEVQVNGLTCSMCNLSVYKALKTISFIDSIQTHLSSALYTITFKSGEIVDPSVLKKQIEDAGFSMGKLELFFLPIEGTITDNMHLSYGDFYFHVLNFPEHISGKLWKAEVKDKKFVSAKEFQRIRKFMPEHTCYETGTTSACCAAEVKHDKAIYHLSF